MMNLITREDGRLKPLDVERRDHYVRQHLVQSRVSQLLLDEAVQVLTVVLRPQDSSHDLHSRSEWSVTVNSRRNIGENTELIMLEAGAVMEVLLLIDYLAWGNILGQFLR